MIKYQYKYISIFYIKLSILFNILPVVVGVGVYERFAMIGFNK